MAGKMGPGMIIRADHSIASVDITQRDMVPTFKYTIAQLQVRGSVDMSQVRQEKITELSRRARDQAPETVGLG
jgi:hypothetical protein